MARSRHSVDFLTVAGVLLSLFAVIGGNMLEGGHTDSLMQMTAFIIVFGGTLGATLVQTPLKIFVHAMKRFRWVFLPPRIERTETLKKIIDWSKIARKEGLLGLQNIADLETEKFAKKGLLLLVDGNEPDEIRKILEVEVDSSADHEMSAARVYEAMGGYSPTIGIIGTGLGAEIIIRLWAIPASSNSSPSITHPSLL